MRLLLKLKDKIIKEVPETKKHYDKIARGGCCQGKSYREIRALIKGKGILPEPKRPNLKKRPFCLDCVRKHLAEAIILLEEVLMGYSEEPHLHWWLCIGHLSQSASEMTGYDTDQANDIRFLRLDLMENREDDETQKTILNQLKQKLKDLAEIEIKDNPVNEDNSNT